MKRKLLTCGFILALCLGAVQAQAQDALPEEEGKEAKQEVQEEIRSEKEILKSKLAKMRGSLLYKKNQIRKFEKLATDTKPALAKKIQALENQRRAEYTAVEPRLKELYKSQDELDAEIKKTAEEVKLMK